LKISQHFTAFGKVANKSMTGFCAVHCVVAACMGKVSGVIVEQNHDCPNALALIFPAAVQSKCWFTAK